jgi:hypothetical protein
MNSPQRVADSTQHVEVVEGRFYLDGEEIAEDRAKELLGDDFPTPSDAQSSAETASEAPAGADGPESVLGRLRAAYAAGEGERETTIPIAPGRYNDLAARYRPIDWELRRRLQRKAQRIGDTGSEAEAGFQATLVADACKEIVVRPKPGEDYVGLHTLLGQFGDNPIRFDSRLAEVLGMGLIGGETEGDICRLVFGDPGAFEVHMTQLTTWSTQVLADDEEDEGGDRPT